MKKRILVVDDDPPMRELLKFKLTNHGGFEVMTARDAKEFSEIALSQPVDLIILDIWLRGWIGTEVYSELLNSGLDPGVPVIFITALLGDEVPSRVTSSGRYALYRKPFNFDELMGQVDRMLAEDSHYGKEERK